MRTQLYLGGAVYSSPAAPDATAFAVTDGTVVWVGTDDVGRALHPDAQVIDLRGHFVSPAFIDSHVHLTDTGLAIGGLDLSGVRGRTECLRELAAYTAANPDEDIIWGLGWDSSTWGESGPGEDVPPTTADVDGIVGDRPVYLARIDEHSAVASSALRRLVDGLAEELGYDEQGPLIAEAHHRIRSTARGLITPQGRRRAQLRALDHAAAHGVVAVHENGGPDISGIADFLSLSELDHPVAVRRYWGQQVSSADEAHAVVDKTGAHAIGGDLFVDGALGSHTAFLSAPYSDQPETRGVAYLTPDEVLTHLRATTEAGIQAGFHVIGDAAAALVADAMAVLADELGTPALARCFHRLEHAEMVTREQAELFARCGVVASMQPMFDALWGGEGQLYEQRLGERGSTLNDFAAMAKAGVSLAFSSDAPVCPIDPWTTVQAAAHHHNPESAISPRAARRGDAWRLACCRNQRRPDRHPRARCPRPLRGVGGRRPRRGGLARGRPALVHRSTVAGSGAAGSDPRYRTAALRGHRRGRRVHLRRARLRIVNRQAWLRPVGAAAAGGILFAAFPPRDLWFLAPIALGVLYACLTVGRPSAKTGAATGAVFGLAFFLPLLPWIGEFVGAFPWIALSVTLAVFTALFGLFATVAMRLPAPPLWFALWWVAIETIRSAFPFGGFPGVRPRSARTRDPSFHSPAGSEFRACRSPSR